MELFQIRKIHKRLLRDNPGNMIVEKKYGGKSILAAVIKEKDAIMVSVISIEDDYMDAKNKEKDIIEFAKKEMS